MRRGSTRLTDEERRKRLLWRMAAAAVERREREAAYQRERQREAAEQRQARAPGPCRTLQGAELEAYARQLASRRR